MSVTDRDITLITPRLRLRPLEPDDARPIHALAGDLGVARMTTSIPHPFYIDQAEDFVGRMREADLDHDRVFAVTTLAGEFAGVLGFHRRQGIAPEVGYWIGRVFWGRGLMTEAVDAALVWARDGWRRQVLISGHFADNPASGRVLIKAGFLYTGEVVQRPSAARGAPAATRMMVWLAQ